MKHEITYSDSGNAEYPRFVCSCGVVGDIRNNIWTCVEDAKSHERRARLDEAMGRIVEERTS